MEIPVDDEIKNDERDDRCPDVEDRVHPDEVDVQVPKVAPGRIKLIGCNSHTRTPHLGSYNEHVAILALYSRDILILIQILHEN